MAQPPTQIKVGPREYSVRWDDETYRRVSLDEGRELEGNSNHPREEMMLRPGRGANWTADTLLHETLHAVLNLHGVNLDNVKEVADLEEYLVSVTSPLLLMVLRDNPDLLAFLLEPEAPWDTPDPSPPAATTEQLRNRRESLIRQGVPERELHQLLEDQ